MKLLGARTVSPLKQHLIQRAVVGCGCPAALLFIGPGPHMFPGSVAQQNQRQVSEELDTEFVAANEMINTVLDFFDRQKWELAVCRRVLEIMFQQFLVLRSFQQQRKLRTPAFRSDFRRGPENPFAFSAGWLQPSGGFYVRRNVFDGPPVDNFQNFPIEAFDESDRFLFQFRRFELKPSLADSRKLQQRVLEMTKRLFLIQSIA